MPVKNKKVLALGVFFILVVIFLSLMRVNKKSEELRDIATTESIDDESFIDYDYTEIEPAIIRKKMRRNPKSVVIVDVRRRTQFEKVHIVDSTNLPADEIVKNNITPHYDADMVVVAFDELNAETISKIVKILEKNNDHVVVLSGGIDAWKRAGGLMISAGNPQSIVDISKITYITPEELREIIEQKKKGEGRHYFILDVRSRTQFNDGHIPYAVNIPLASIERRRSSIPITKDIIVYGSTSLDSFRAGVRLYDLNFTTKTLKGGYIDWVRGKNPIERSPSHTKENR